MYVHTYDFTNTYQIDSSKLRPYMALPPPPPMICLFIENKLINRDYPAMDGLGSGLKKKYDWTILVSL